MEYQVSHGTQDGRHQPTRAGGQPREAIHRIAEQLRQVEARIVALCATLPEPADRFDAQAQLREALECVSRDLIADAIQTLELAAEGGGAGLRRDFDRRQRLLAAPRGYRCEAAAKSCRGLRP